MASTPTMRNAISGVELRKVELIDTSYFTWCLSSTGLVNDIGCGRQDESTRHRPWLIANLSLLKTPVILPGIVRIYKLQRVLIRLGFQPYQRAKSAIIELTSNREVASKWLIVYNRLNNLFQRAVEPNRFLPRTISSITVFLYPRVSSQVGNGCRDEINEDYRINRSWRSLHLICITSDHEITVQLLHLC